MTTNANIPTAQASAGAPRYFMDSYLRPGTEQFHQYQLVATDSPNHCGPFSAAMAVNIVTGQPVVTGLQIAGLLTKNFIEWKSLLPRINRFPPRAYTFPGAIANFLRRDGVNARAHVFGSLGQLRASLLAGRVPVVLHGEPFRFEGLRWKGWSHWKVVVGYTPTQFLFQDPWLKDPQPVAGDIVEFDRYWRNMLRAWVDVGR
ncbi:MAG TPA: C39 family peptidase [Thermoflexales bacterium]|nr:C39 family peptidase [Thermoflexales bacterium]HQW34738.1 C39 family peptidase [Thermoflexales bacterium]HQZ23332.1 C39 family peptidase [Thermoflexales bacterium]HRA01583.1 C39 family peptidase [Thermoflexales bacterium]